MKEFEDILSEMNDNAFNLWIKGWFDEQIILDVFKSWDNDLKKEELENMRNSIKRARLNELREIAVEKCFELGGQGVFAFLREDEAEEFGKLQKELGEE